jgi:peptide deformylase
MNSEHTAVLRHKKCHITCQDLNWTEHSMVLGELSELSQPEVDHLNGISR